MKSIYTRFKELLLDKKLISQNDNILIGVSGGADSMALLELFIELKREIAIDITCAHVNYQLRGDDSDLDEKLVEEKCRNENIKYHLLKVNSKMFDKAVGTGIEEKARFIRYSFFDELMEKNKHSKISVAHTKEDLSETLIFNFIRGTSPQKFSNIMEIYDFNKKLLRPLIIFDKEELAQYNSSMNVKYRLDKTNLQTTYSRNKIRNSIIPLFLELNPSFFDSIIRFREILRIDEAFMDNHVKLLMRSENIIKNNNFISFLRLFYVNLDDAIKNRLIREIRLDLVGDLKDFTFSQIIYIRDGIVKSPKFNYTDKFMKMYINKGIIIFEKIQNNDK